MGLEGVKIGLGVTGSFCTIDNVYKIAEEMIKNGAEVYPILSYNVATMDTRGGNAKDIIGKIEKITEKKVIATINDAEPIGPKSFLDVLVIAPCTGNTLAKIANGITDTPVTMACKAHLRNLKPVVISVSTNDGLGINARNIAFLLDIKNIYFVPFGQDNPEAKPKSLVSDINRIIPTVNAALKGKQIQPILI